MADLTPLLDDLAAESAGLESTVADLPDAAWRTPTPAPGWTVAHQIAHLAWTDDIAHLSATDPDAFVAEMKAALPRLSSFVDEVAGERADEAPADLVSGWRAGRDRLVETLASVPEGQKLVWFGPPMSAASMATARIMETWAHGQDVVDALGVTRPGTDRLRHVAHIGTRTRDFAYLLHDRTPPTEPFRIELTAPSGEIWSWGPEDAAQRVTGSALDFCLLVTQRRHRDDLDVTPTGPDADAWLDIAQAFAGPPGWGRQAGAFPTKTPR